MCGPLQTRFRDSAESDMVFCAREAAVKFYPRGYGGSGAAFMRRALHRVIYLAPF